MRVLASGLVLSLLGTASAGCLDPLVGDEVIGASLILPQGSEVPDAHDDPAVDEQIALNDGVDARIPLRFGFAAGGTVAFWDFGATPEIAAPIFALVARDENDEIVMVPHRTIIDTIPGAPGYSPYWAVWLVEVTDRYRGEIIASVAAMQEAQERGLLLAPVRAPVVVNCPAVARDVTLEVGAGGADLEPPSRFYWRGKTVRYYEFGASAISDSVTMPEAPRFRLRREGQEPLSEPVRGIDMTGDGDTNDSNDILSRLPTDDSYTPQCRTVNVVVSAEYSSIDTALDQSMAEYRAATDLFDPEPVGDKIIAFEVTGEVRNCPMQRQPGAL